MPSLSYYADLARRLSAGEVAKTAMRRAYRRARHALYRPHPELDAKRVLEGFRVSSPSGLPDAVCRLERPGWCDVRHRLSVRSALERIPGAVDRALERAERACARTIEAYGVRVSFEPNEALDWSWDPVSGFHYPAVPSATIDLLKGGADARYPWAMGRLDSLLALGQGAWVAADSAQRARFAEAFVAFLSDFIVANPPGIGIQWTCPMEVALRGANIAQALLMFRDAPEVRRPEFLWLALTSLLVHADFVEAHLEDDTAVPNNHLVGDWVGLLAIGLCFPELPGSAAKIAAAVSGLREQLGQQVHPDGASFEGSVPYHRLATELFTLGFLLARDSGVDLGSGYAGRLARMYRVARALTSERGLAPQLGDNDSSRALPLADRASLDYGYLPALGAAVFRDALLKAHGADFPDEAAWLLGDEGRRAFEALQPTGATPFSSPAGGWHVLRNGRASVFIGAGPRGQRGVGGHNHNDQLSFELHLDGVPLIVDPGSPTYGRDLEVRDIYRGTAFHNTVQIDGLEQSPVDPVRPFALPDATRTELLSLERRPEQEVLVARHSGYRELGDVWVQRTWRLDAQAGALEIEDAVHGIARHAVVLRVHFLDEAARIRQNIVELGPPGQPRAVLVFERGPRLELESYEYSPGYGEVIPALRLVARSEGELPKVLRWKVLYEGFRRVTTCA